MQLGINVSKVKVVRFEVWDGNDNVLAPRYATREAIERLQRQGAGASEIVGSEIEVDDTELDGNGFVSSPERTSAE